MLKTYIARSAGSPGCDQRNIHSKKGPAQWQSERSRARLGRERLTRNIEFLKWHFTKN